MEFDFRYNNKKIVASLFITRSFLNCRVMQGDIFSIYVPTVNNLSVTKRCTQYPDS